MYNVYLSICLLIGYNPLSTTALLKGAAYKFDVDELIEVDDWLIDGNLTGICDECHDFISMGGEFGFRLWNKFCIPESFYTNKSPPAFWLHNNICESTALEHKFKWWFCAQKAVLNVRFKDFWYTKINPNQIWYDNFNL